MSDSKVRLVQLPPFRVASFHAYGAEPEVGALEKLHAWAGAKGLLESTAKPRIFGFNNPNPSTGSPNYGYEVWITVDPETQPESGIEFKGFPGGLYAVLHWDGKGDPYETIPAAWTELIKWLEASPYHESGPLCLEEHLPPDDDSQAGFALNLYLPVTK